MIGFQLFYTFHRTFVANKCLMNIAIKRNRTRNEMEKVCIIWIKIKTNGILMKNGEYARSDDFGNDLMWSRHASMQCITFYMNFKLKFIRMLSVSISCDEFPCICVTSHGTFILSIAIQLKMPISSTRKGNHVKVKAILQPGEKVIFHLVVEREVWWIEHEH